MSMMFSSPVSIRLSAGIVWVAPVPVLSATRPRDVMRSIGASLAGEKPTSTRLMRVTEGVSAASTGQGMW